MIFLSVDLVQPAGYGNIASLLTNTPGAHTEVKGIRRFWVHSNGACVSCLSLSIPLPVSATNLRTRP